jgi:uncharacterized membrane protein YeaQ/YmgE (transglycosylase-associated protein family)
LVAIEGAGTGFVASKIMSGEGHDLLMDTVMGAAGGVAGGFIAGGSGQRFQGNWLYTSLAAITGASALSILSRLFGGRREYSSTN